MRTTNYIDFGNNLEEYLDSVAQNGESLIIHRPNNESVVIMPIEEYNALKKAEYLMRSKGLEI
ncbi:type II toxin-antitoxin system Phd/YefM family antitoxin [Prevotella sp. HUN102]|uniref:type II toxin-antitoxin system Phd/YefM family antitoxin n=1 Tax=Prevotella sp. HUN102 TaxID=1392486 RepID=UPI00068EDB9B|nr:type II toxin-antitoxin system Phd/YefM family antitoxin [Prevotella sp. HUN102]